MEFSGVNHQNVACLRLMVNKTFPLSYGDNLYIKIAHDYKTFTFFAYLDDIPVGGISCRVEPREAKNNESSLYILILSVLPKYRRGNIATKLLNEVIRRVHAEPEAKDVKSIYLHTPVHNQAAIKFYEKNGFKVAEKVPDYYKSFMTPEENIAVVLDFDIVRAEQKDK